MHYRSMDELRRKLAQGGGDVKIVEDPVHAEAALHRPPMTDAQRELARLAREILQQRFATVWRQLGGSDELVAEFYFAPDRDWRSDFAVPLAWVLIEVEGGTYLRGGGRHNRPQGYEDDCIKYLNAALMGYTIFRFTARMMVPIYVQPVIDFVDKRLAALSQG